MKLASIVAGMLLSAAVPAAAQTARPPATDQTIAVTKGQRLEVNNFAGEVMVKAWNRDELRVTAEHDSRTKVGDLTRRLNVLLRSSAVRWTQSQRAVTPPIRPRQR